MLFVPKTLLYLQTLHFHPEPICRGAFGQVLLPSIMQPNLPVLSTEVVEIVARKLQRPELCSLRLACRDLYQKSLGIFARLHNTVKTDLSAQSFRKLVEMSDSTYLAPHIRTLHFRAEKKRHFGRGFEWSRSASGGLKDPPAGASSLLQNILENKLVNCRSFQIDNYGESNMQMASAWVLTPGDVVSLVCYIVVNANLQIKSLTVGGQDEAPSWLNTVRLRSLCPHYEVVDQQGLLSWGSLDTLILRFNMSPSQYDWALDLLKNAPAVRQLSLRLEFEQNWDFFPLLADLGPFSALESLSLDDFSLDGTTFSRFLLQHGNTLRCLTLRHVELAPHYFNEEAGGSWEARTSWETVFGNMIGQMNRLEQVSVRSLLQRRKYRDIARVIFPPLSADDTYPVVPGSEEPPTGIGHLGAESRVVAGLESPIQLKYQPGNRGKWISGVSYQGRQIDGFLALLIKAKETEN